ncbi:Acetyltransferase YpeA [Rubripirellula lacrimiformis]|uniref:Acetyltransferase YpeA n=1 Tax=Rubripirellula lacrimiformis TaxID=1930273 RepID=A0A517N9N8_9BACT|nr:Acetyltransferase YpeA [Rubripirellula lacrimiformis]
MFPDSTGHNDPAESIDRKCKEGDGLFFVAEQDGTVVGMVMAGYDGHRGWIYSLAVAPTQQRRGIGSMLVRHVERMLGELGCPKVNLQVRTRNSSVVAFYHSMGFDCEDRISMGKLLSRSGDDALESPSDTH